MENQINFEDLFDLAEIQAIQDNFAQATGVASIITTVDGRPIQLLLTDMIMPFLGGLKLAEQLRSRWPDLKVLLMSGYPNGVALPDSGPEAKYVYLQKPFTAETLACLVRQLLEQ